MTLPNPTAARQIGKAWRQNPNDRARIECMIAATGRQSEFRRDASGNLVARITPAIREQINGASGGYMGTSSDRQFYAEMLDPAIVSAAGMGVVRFTERAPCGFYRDAEAA